VQLITNATQALIVSGHPLLRFYNVPLIFQKP